PVGGAGHLEEVAVEIVPGRRRTPLVAGPLEPPISVVFAPPRFEVTVPRATRHGPGRSALGVNHCSLSRSLYTPGQPARVTWTVTTSIVFAAVNGSPPETSCR